MHASAFIGMYVHVRAHTCVCMSMCERVLVTVWVCEHVFECACAFYADACVPLTQSPTDPLPCRSVCYPTAAQGLCTIVWTHSL
jgi:hypothetical protein